MKVSMSQKKLKNVKPKKTQNLMQASKEEPLQDGIQMTQTSTIRNASRTKF